MSNCRVEPDGDAALVLRFRSSAAKPPKNKQNQKKTQKSCVSPCLIAERNPMEETERSLQTLIKLACNAECIPSLVDGLSVCLSSILTINEQGDHPALDRLLHNLFNQMLQVRLVMPSKIQVPPRLIRIWTIRIPGKLEVMRKLHLNVPNTILHAI